MLLKETRETIERLGSSATQSEIIEMMEELFNYLEIENQQKFLSIAYNLILNEKILRLTAPRMDEITKQIKEYIKQSSEK